MSDNRLTLDVYVPALGSKIRETIARGSGIVGTVEAPPGQGGRVILDYEGNLYRSVNIKTWADKVMIAAGRHLERYPTVARISVRLSDVAKIGYWDEITGRVVTGSFDATLLEEWLDMPNGIPAHELMAHGSKWGRW